MFVDSTVVDVKVVTSKASASIRPKEPVDVDEALT